MDNVMTNISYFVYFCYDVLDEYDDYDYDFMHREFVGRFQIASPEEGKNYLRSLGFEEDEDGQFKHPKFMYYAIIREKGTIKSTFPTNLDELYDEIKHGWMSL